MSNSDEACPVEKVGHKIEARDKIILNEGVSQIVEAMKFNEVQKNDKKDEIIKGDEVVLDCKEISQKDFNEEVIKDVNNGRQNEGMCIDEVKIDESQIDEVGLEDNLRQNQNIDGLIKKKEIIKEEKMSLSGKERHIEEVMQNNEECYDEISQNDEPVQHDEANNHNQEIGQNEVVNLKVEVINEVNLSHIDEVLENQIDFHDEVSNNGEAVHLDTEVILLIKESNINEVGQDDDVNQIQDISQDVDGLFHNDKMGLDEKESHIKEVIENHEECRDEERKNDEPVQQDEANIHNNKISLKDDINLNEEVINEVKVSQTEAMSINEIKTKGTEAIQLIKDDFIIIISFITDSYMIQRN